jgi:hypothetical protein
VLVGENQSRAAIAEHRRRLERLLIFIGAHLNAIARPASCVLIETKWATLREEAHNIDQTQPRDSTLFLKRVGVPDMLPELSPSFIRAQEFIDSAHALDPSRTNVVKDGTMIESDIPYELHYAREMTRWLAIRCPTASPTLQLACRAQHFQRSVSSRVSSTRVS